MFDNKNVIKKTVDINGRQLIFQVGELAPQANAAVLAQMGETIVLATVVSGRSVADLDYLPLSVEYQEKLYAGGKIKGSRWVKREGRPSDESILTARLIDRSIRPLFPENYRNEVQVIITVLSFDGENDPDVLSICATSAALAISDIPWNGPVAGIRAGYKEGTFFADPTYKEREFSDLDLIISSTEKAIVMVEAGANEVNEKEAVGGLVFAQEEITKIIKAIKELRKEIGKEKQTIEEENNEKLRQQVEEKASKRLKSTIEKMIRGESGKEDLQSLKEDLKTQYKEENQLLIENIVDNLFKEHVRKQILEKKLRSDGRKPDEIRTLSIEVGVLPRTHGSAIFQRGQTQALTVTTLASPSLEQWIESIEGEETKRYIHHYNMPPFTVGEVGRLGWPSRREVGHGALAERALIPMIPSEDKFPYTIRVVSEIMSSNGSTSMASVCGSTLSLMDAGVPLKKPVAGIAMGLIADFGKKDKNEIKNYIVLTDIAGIEDHLGDMDFKVAGTADGITALQMDVKIIGITPEILAKAFGQAKQARLYILDKMNAVLPAPRTRVSVHAPIVSIVQVPKDKIGEVIGPGGRMIRQIISDTGVAMDINDEGRVTISAIGPEAVKKATDWVEGLIKEVQVGEIFEGEVKRIQPFGAFVEVLPGKEGLVHVSKMSAEFVSNPGDIVKIGDKVQVKVVEIDDLGRINLSMILDDSLANKDRSKPSYQQNPRKEFRKRPHFNR